MQTRRAGRRESLDTTCGPDSLASRVYARSARDVSSRASADRLRSGASLSTARLLYVEASPRGAQSFSARVAAAFLQGFLEKNPGALIDCMYLFETPLPEFDHEAAEWITQHALEDTARRKAAALDAKWTPLVQEIDRLTMADKVVISSAMWNLSVPYKLKQYIDIVVQPGLTIFSDKNGKRWGAMQGKRLQLILASGGNSTVRAVNEGSASFLDFHSLYLEQVGKLLGFTEVQTLMIRPTVNGTHEDIDVMLKEKLAEAYAVGADF